MLKLRIDFIALVLTTVTACEIYFYVYLIFNF